MVLKIEMKLLFFHKLDFVDKFIYEKRKFIHFYKLENERETDESFK